MFRSGRFSKTLFVLLGSGLLGAFNLAHAQTPDVLAVAEQDADPVDFSSSDGASAIPAAEEGSEPFDSTLGSPPNTLGGFETPVSPAFARSVFRNTGAPFSGFTAGGITNTGEVRAGTFRERISVPRPSFRLGLPLPGQGFAPSDATLKLGPVYLKLHSLTAAATASDNVELSDRDRHAGVVSAVQLNATILAQFGEGLQLAVSGSLTYLPFQGKIGLQGFGLDRTLLIGLAAAQALASQISYDTVIAGWPVRFADDFRVSTARFSESTRDDFVLFEGERFEEVDREGRYEFGGRRGRSKRSRDDRDSRSQDDLIYFSNSISAATERLLPDAVRLRASIFHESLWYNQGNRGMPGARYGAKTSLTSERESLRFKPFLSYQVEKIEGRQGIEQRLTGGVRGPITDQLSFHGEAGYFLGGNGRNALLFRLSLDHIAGPLTNERLTLGRTLTDFAEEIATFASYEFHQILGPGLQAGFFATFTDFLNNGNGDTSSRRDEIRTGLRLQYFVSPRTQAELGLTQAHITRSVNSASQDTYTARLSLSYHITDTFSARLLYQYQRRDSTSRNQNYYENVVFLTLTKFLDP